MSRRVSLINNIKNTNNIIIMCYLSWTLNMEKNNNVLLKTIGIKKPVKLINERYIRLNESTPSLK